MSSHKKQDCVNFAVFTARNMCFYGVQNNAKRLFQEGQKRKLSVPVPVSQGQKRVFVCPSKLSRRGTKTRFPFLSGTGTKTYI
nr:MAG TPA: hypothetical protein [Bacteriophage sp.]